MNGSGLENRIAIRKPRSPFSPHLMLEIINIYGARRQVMYFINTKEEEARAELQNIVNHEYSQFVNRDRKSGVVNFEAIRLEGLHGIEYRKEQRKARVMDIVFGNHFDEHAQHRVHYITKELWNGDYTVEQAKIIIPVLKQEHRKTVCEDCENGHPLRIPSLETIANKVYGGVLD